NRFQFSPGGTYLSFVRSEDGVDRIFLMSMDDGEVSRLTNNQGDVFAYDWSSDESTVFFAADDARTPAEKKRYEMGEDWFFVDEGSNGRIAARWRNLWSVRLSDSRLNQVTSGEYIVDELDVSPDGERIAFVARPDNRRNYPHTAELYLVGSTGGSVQRLTENLAPESRPIWSPDGTRLAYYAPSDENYELTKGYLWVMDPETREYRQLHAQSAGDIYGLRWAVDGKALLFSEQQGMHRNLFRLDVGKDELVALTARSGTTNVSSMSSDQKHIVFSYSNFDTPLDIYTARSDLSDVVRLTNANPWIEDEIELGETRVVNWKSKDGLDIEGILILPPGYDGGERIPLLLQIHGGPNQQFANEFYQDLHLYSALGFAVLGGNIRGSSGYGDPFIKALIGDVSRGEYDDVMSGVDHIIEMGIADPDRLAVRGWSWGGVLSSWVVTQTDRFKAASIGAGVMSWLSEMGPGFNWDLTEWYMDKPHWEDPAGWRQVSSLTYVHQVTTPSLIIHGDDDWYSSYNQSLIFYTGLRDVGKAPARFISYPGRGHEQFDPWAQRARYSEEIGWLQKYVNQIDWSLPTRY
ncbi:MAG: S9 family peptidase, partial [Planctomycetota bacterium]